MGIGPQERVLLGANLGRAIVTNGDFTGSVCDMPAPSELRFGVMLAVGRGTAVLDGGQRSPTGRGRFVTRSSAVLSKNVFFCVEQSFVEDSPAN